jgi:hypothetical protein
MNGLRRFSDGYASNIARLIDLGDCRLYIMKSHDYHVSMQTLIPIIYRDLFSKEMWDATNRD